MFCKNCGNKLNDGEEVCPVCQEAAEKEEEATEVKPEKRSSFSSFFKEKLKLSSIFDDSISRTPLEKAVSSKYFALIVITFLLFTLWLSKPFVLTTPPLPIFDGLEFEMNMPMSASDLMTGLDLGEDILVEYMKIVPEESMDADSKAMMDIVMIVINVIVISFRVLEYCTLAIPFIITYALLRRSVQWKRWHKFPSVILWLGFINQTVIFLVLQLVAFYANQSLEADSFVSVSLTLEGYIFLALYITSFVLLSKIKKQARLMRRQLEKAAEAEELE